MSAARQAICLLAARVTFHLCNSRKQFEAGAVPKQGSRCARPEGHDRDLAGEGKLQRAQESRVNSQPARSQPIHLNEPTSVCVVGNPISAERRHRLANSWDSTLLF